MQTDWRPRELGSVLASASLILLLSLTAFPARGAMITEEVIGYGFAGSSVNTLAGSQYTLFTAELYQYAAFYDAHSRMTLAQRDPAGWKVVATAHRGNVADAHNAIALAVDGDGFLHVAWDHHNSALTYARSLGPRSVVLGDPVPMTGDREKAVTYPAFLPLPGGDLLFLYRDGGSGRGDLVLNRYFVATRKWSTVQRTLISGEGKRNAYVSAFVDAQGTLHAAWVWRETPDVSTNHDICYARSKDAGRTWTTSEGQPLELPIRASAAEYVLRIPEGSSLMNPPSVTADEAGNVGIANYWAARGEKVPQYHVVWKEDGAWHVQQVTQRTRPFVLTGTATKRPPISRSVLVARTGPDGDREVHLVFRDDEESGSAVGWTCRRLGKEEWTRTALTQASLGAWEPSYDPVAWRTRGELHMLVQQVEQRDGNDTVPADAPFTPVRVITWKP